MPIPTGCGNPCCRFPVPWADGQSGRNRVNRGGSWNNDARNLRSANRNNNSPGNRNDNLGFRLVRQP